MNILVLLAATIAASAALLAVLSRVLPADFLAAAFTPRSNHSAPARQIGGLAVAPVAIAMLCVAAVMELADPQLLLSAAAAATALSVLGFLDDRRDLSVAARFAGQFVAAILFLWFLDPQLRLLPDMVPLPAERAVLAVALVWFVNMVNFMDGLDLMVVSGVGVPHALLALLGMAGVIDPAPAVLSAVIAGALFGFAPFNWPAARIFLGDSGSLSIGLLCGVVALLLALQSPWAALLPLLFYLIDSVSTLATRMLRGENILASHSAHAYQVVRRAGRPVLSIVGEVALLGIICAILAAVALIGDAAWTGPFALACGLAVTCLGVLRMRRQAKATRA